MRLTRMDRGVGGAMRRRRAMMVVGLCAVLLLSGAPGLANPSGYAPQRQVAPPGLEGDVIVLLDDADQVRAAEAVEVALDAVDEAPTRVFDSVINGFAATLTADEVEALGEDPRVVAIYPDLPIHAAAQTLPTGVNRVDADVNPVAKIDGVDERVNASVAVFDSGINSHSELNLAGGIDCSGPNTGDFADDFGHGTHVAGTIGAIDNGDAVVGVAPGTQLWAVKVLDDSGLGSTSTVICGLNWVAANAGAVDVINMSLAQPCPGGSCAGYEPLRLAIANTVNSIGIPVIVAAGNAPQGGSPTNAVNVIPAAYSEAIAVSGISDNDGMPGNDTRFVRSNYGSVIDIAAPAVDILSIDGGSGSVKSGTSMAAAHVSGAAALYLSQNPGASPGQVKSWLLSTARPQNSSGGFTDDVDTFAEPVVCVGACGSAAISLNRTRSTVNVNVTISIVGFPANQSVTVSFVGTTYPSTTSVTTNGAGQATAVLKVPATPKGVYSIRAVRESVTAQAPFEVVPRVKVIPGDVSRGQTVDVSLRGYGKKEMVRIRWKQGSSWVQVAEVQTSNSGSANVDVVVPSWVPDGATSVRGDGPIGRAQTNAVTVSGGAALQSASETTPTPTATPAGTPIAEPSTPQPALTATPEETPTATEAPTESPTPDATPHAVVGGGSSDPNVPALLALDGDPLTYWEVPAPASETIESAADGTPQAEDVAAEPKPDAFLVLDLGSPIPLGTVRWLFAVEGEADAMTIEISDDLENWTPVTQPDEVGNALAGEWQELVLPAGAYAAQYVRFAFTNPNGDPYLGGIAEIEVWP